jgi:hypothetical protein
MSFELIMKLDQTNIINTIASQFPKRPASNNLRNLFLFIVKLIQPNNGLIIILTRVKGISNLKLSLITCKIGKSFMVSEPISGKMVMMNINANDPKKRMVNDLNVLPKILCIFIYCKEYLDGVRGSFIFFK